MKFINNKIMNLINDENKPDSENIEKLEQDSKDEEKKKKLLITLGECSKYYFIILGDVISKFVSYYILGAIKNMGLFGFSPKLTTYGVVKSIYTYIGYIIFGTIYYFCFRGKKIINENNNLNELTSTEVLIMEKSKFTYLQIFLVCFCFGLYIEIQNLLYGLGIRYLNFWSLGTIFTFLLMKKYFPYDIYRHHKLAIIFISITVTTFILICSILPESSDEEEEELNTYQSVKSKFGSYYYSILIILIFIFVNFIYAYSINYSKVLILCDHILKETLR